MRIVNSVLQRHRRDSSRAIWFAAALLAAVSLLIALEGDTARAWLAYDRGALARGQWWRLISAHLVHLSLSHTLMNVAGLAVLTWIGAPLLGVGAYLRALVLPALTVSAGLWLAAPEVSWYVGLSGVLHGLWAAVACELMAAGAPGGRSLLFLLAVKLLWEWFAGPVPGSEAVAGGTVITRAHLFGAAGGMLASAPVLFSRGAGDV